MIFRQRWVSFAGAAVAAAALAGCAAPGYYQPGQGAYPAGQPASAGYSQFGRVADVRYVQGSGSSGVAGTVIGGAVGGLAGHQVGGGSGKTAATIIGAVGGALVGRAVEQNTSRGGQGVYRVTVQMDNGGTRTFDYADAPSVQVGDRVRADGNQLYR
ncbi:MAG: glycine zipper 2TM domain-containing protein [Proteobacteria bacterium]|nr:glycine zipper 2TM domain-containing protein [Pseudomonadota bacterium]